MVRSIGVTVALSAFSALSGTGCNAILGLDPVSRGVDAGNGGDGGPADRPSLVYPEQTQLTSQRVYFFWHDGTHPSGPVQDNFELCMTSGALDGIAGENQCPGSRTLDRNRLSLDASGLQRGNYYWKIRNTDPPSPWSGIGRFFVGGPPLNWYPMENNAEDLGSNQISAEARGGIVFGAGVVGNAAWLDGIDGRIAASNTAFLVQEALSVSAFVYIENAPAGGDVGILTIGEYGIALTYGADGSVVFSINSNANNVRAPLGAGAWHHVVGTFDGTTAAEGMKLYIDGRPAATHDSTQAVTNAAGSFLIGLVGGNGYLHGRVDDAALYDRVLSGAEVLNMYCAAVNSGTTGSPSACTP